MEKICYVVGAGSWSGPDFCPRQEDLVIAADGGLRQLEERGIRVDFFVGDRDSLCGEADVPQERQMKLPVMKNDTDMLAALRYGWQQGYRQFRLLGGTGGARADHTMANIQCLAWLAGQGGRGILYETNQALCMVKNGTLTLPDELEGTVSVFAYGGEARGVTLTGLLYPLDRVTLTPDFPLGVSNEPLAHKKSSITVEDGMLLVYYPWKASSSKENSK